MYFIVNEIQTYSFIGSHCIISINRGDGPKHICGADFKTGDWLANIVCEQNNNVVTKKRLLMYLKDEQ